MKDQGSQKGKGHKTTSPETASTAAPDGKAPVTRVVEMTSKEKIAANQKNKRRK